MSAVPYPVLIVGVLVCSAALSWAVVALSIRLAHRVGAYDHPDGGRKTQALPIPKLGGLAVALAFTVSSLAMLILIGRAGDAYLAAAALAPALGGAAVGYLDDKRHLNPWLRLAAQAGLAAAAWFLGSRIAVVGVPWMDTVVVILWIILVVNGINLLDNSDGLAGTTVMVSAIGASIVAWVFGQQLVTILGIALVGVCLGYLWHNWHPATVYLGDSGAYFLGFLLSILIIRLRPETLAPLEGVVIAICLVLLPVVDVGYVVIRRLRAGIHPFTAGRDHLSHTLQGRGASIPQSVIALQAILGVGVVLAVVLAVMSK